RQNQLSGEYSCSSYQLRIKDCTFSTPDSSAPCSFSIRATTRLTLVLLVSSPFDPVVILAQFCISHVEGHKTVCIILATWAGYDSFCAIPLAKARRLRQ